MIKTGVKSQVLIFSSKPFLRGCVYSDSGLRFSITTHMHAMCRYVCETELKAHLLSFLLHHTTFTFFEGLSTLKMECECLVLLSIDIIHISRCFLWPHCRAGVRRKSLEMQLSGTYNQIHTALIFRHSLLTEEWHFIKFTIIPRFPSFVGQNNKMVN